MFRVRSAFCNSGQPAPRGFARSAGVLGALIVLAAHGCKPEPEVAEPWIAGPGRATPIVAGTSPVGNGPAVSAAAGGSGTGAAAPDAGPASAGAAGTAPIEQDAAPIEIDAQVPDAALQLDAEAPSIDAAPPVDAAPPIDAATPAADSGSDASTSPFPCEFDLWELATGFRPALKVDYIADRQGFDPPQVISSAGVPCETAQNKPDCQAALEIPTQFGRHLATTQGDVVRLWPIFAAQELLGAIDTLAEALWWMSQHGFYVPCGASSREAPEGFRIQGVVAPFCGSILDAGDVGEYVVRSDGEILFPPEFGGGSALCNGVTLP